MKYRTATLLATESQSGAGTKTIDVNVADIISRILIRWGVTKTHSGMDSYPHKDITKIELVDGSDVLHGMDGGENQALCIFDRRCPTMNEGININANEVWSSYGIDFGRYLFDPMLALDPKRFKNLQLKITFDSNVCDTGVSAGNLAVFLECFDEKLVTPMGFLSAKEIYNAVPPSSGYRYIDLPTDRTIRRLIIQGYLSAYEPWYTVNEARLDEDNDKRVVFDWNMEEYFKFRQSIDPMVRERGVVEASTTGRVHYATPTDFWATFMWLPAGSTQYWYQDQYGRGGYFKCYSATDNESRGEIFGWLPNHCFNIPFGDPQDPTDWYDVSKIGNLRLRLKVGTYSASAAMAVILQQLRKY